MDILTTSIWATCSSGRPLATLACAQGKGQVDAWQTEKAPRVVTCLSVVQK